MLCPHASCPGVQVALRWVLAQFADGPDEVCAMVRRPAHSGRAAVARLPRCARHGVALAAGRSQYMAPTGGRWRSRCTLTQSPPGPYHVPWTSHQPCALPLRAAATKGPRSDTSPSHPEAGPRLSATRSTDRAQAGAPEGKRPGCSARPPTSGCQNPRRAASSGLLSPQGSTFHRELGPTSARRRPEASWDGLIPGKRQPLQLQPPASAGSTARRAVERPPARAPW